MKSFRPQIDLNHSTAGYSSKFRQRKGEIFPPLWFRTLWSSLTPTVKAILPVKNISRQKSLSRPLTETITIATDAYLHQKSKFSILHGITKSESATATHLRFRNDVLHGVRKSHVRNGRLSVGERGSGTCPTTSTISRLSFSWSGQGGVYRVCIQQKWLNGWNAGPVLKSKLSMSTWISSIAQIVRKYQSSSSFTRMPSNIVAERKRSTSSQIWCLITKRDNRGNEICRDWICREYSDIVGTNCPAYVLWITIGFT